MLANCIPMAMTPPKQLGSNEGPIVSSWVNLAIENVRLNLPPHITPGSHTVVHLAYWHCRLLAYLLMPSALSSDVFWAAKELVNLLMEHPRLHTPWNHHFSALAAATLLEAAKGSKGRDEATKILKELHDVHFAPSAWDTAIKSKIAEKILRPGTSSGIDSYNLQHLADLATATTELTSASSAAKENAPPENNEEPPIKYRTANNYEDLGFDPRPMLQAGYLNYFAAEAENVVE